MRRMTVGSICSGIEAASVALKPWGFSFRWFSEIAPAPSAVLAYHYPDISNLGDMDKIENLLLSRQIESPDFLCAGTPCQAFSLAGLKRGLKDRRANLTLKLIDIVNANDLVRKKEGKDSTVLFWENVEGVLRDKTNAFGCFVSSLTGISNTLNITRWPPAGVIYGPNRNLAWRVLDAKYFGIPQQRRRLYVLVGGKNFYPENVLFELQTQPLQPIKSNTPLSFDVGEDRFELFRSYTDCLYSAYGTKWNGNAAAYNGSLFIAQNERVRRFSPLECERLMGFSDGYTDIPGLSYTARYQCLGNSWAVPVIAWIGKRLSLYKRGVSSILQDYNPLLWNTIGQESSFICFKKNELYSYNDMFLNTTTTPATPVYGDLRKIVENNPRESLYLTPVGCYGIIRRKKERDLPINPRLETLLRQISLQMPQEIIDKKSFVQKRGKFSS